VLQALCAALDVEFSERMLSWPPGPRASDGVWAPHWYGAVERSTGFAPYRAEDVTVPRHLADLTATAERIYDRMADHRLTRVKA
jgi:hypothetical protein